MYKSNILILTSEFPPLPGGIGNHAYHLAKNLKESNYSPIVIADQRDADLGKEIDFDNNQSFKIERIARRKITLITYINRVVTTIRLIKNQHIVIASGKFPLWLIGFLSLIFTKQKYIAVIHGSELKAGGKIAQQLTKWSLKRYHKLIAVSNFTKDLTLEIQPSIMVRVINNGFSPKGNYNDAITNRKQTQIITVGNVTSRKGQQNVIKALPEIKKIYPEICYHIVGIPTQKDEFLKLAQQLQVEDAVIFHGALSDEQLLEKMLESSVFLMLSDHLSNGDVEGFGIAVLEANHLNLPAIGSKNSGIADAIKDGYSGRLVDPHNAKDVAQALNEILTNYNSYSAGAKEWSSNFDWKKIITKYIQVIEQ